MTNRVSRIVATGIVALIANATAVGDTLPECTIDFEDSCPDVSPQCGATFSGGASCAFENLFFCYSSGLFSYKVSPTEPLTITLSDDLNRLEVFFVHQGFATGTMRFFDAEVDGNEVGSPLMTNGDCLAEMAAPQSVAFGTPVRRIEVTTQGWVSWIDDFHVNPPAPPCPADIDGDEEVAFGDLLQLLATWGPCVDCPEDLDDDDEVGFQDLLIMLAAWGSCP